MENADLLTQLSIVIALGSGIALIMHRLRQPLILGHVLTGIIAGPVVLNIIQDGSSFSVLGSFGVVLLLFIVGLELSLKIISRLGKVVVITTLAQMAVMTLAGAAGARLLDYGRLESVIIGVSLALSSTIIIITLLQQRKELMRLFAQIAVGVLILQDLFATLGKITLSARSTGGSWLEFFLLFGRGILFVVALYIFSRFIFPRVTRYLETSKELLLVTSMGWALGIATLCAKIGFSLEVGALLAGMSMAGLPVSREVASRLRPMRDFFVVVFLITIGYSIAPSLVHEVWVAAIAFSLLVFILKPLVVLIALGAQGYTKRSSFKTAITMSQISEFSLVFVYAAVQHNYASQSVQAAIGITALITFAGSAYLIKYSDQIYSVLERHLRLFERKVTEVEQRNALHSFPIILFGYRKGGAEFIRTFKGMNKRFVVVDYDPEAIELIEKQQVEILYGDATDVELLEELQLEKSKLVVSTISDFATNEFLAHWLKEHNPGVVFITSAETSYQAAHLYSEGAAYVMMPHFIGSEKISTFIKRTGFKKSEFHKYREKHLKYLEAHYSEEPA